MQDAGSRTTGQINQRSLGQTGQGSHTPDPDGPLVPLDEARFKRLDPETSGAFLLWNDATSDIKEMYASSGLKDRSGQRRIARVVKLKKGMRLFKATQYEERWLRSPLSPWWSTVEPFHENSDGALELVQIAEENGMHFRDLVRFISAVSLDWNKLDWYVEIVLRVDLYAFWGQFAPQKGIQNAPTQGVVATQHPDATGGSTFVNYGDGRQVHLADMLGGFGAWQLYIPNFDKHFIDPSEIRKIDATDNRRLASYLKSRR